MRCEYYLIITDGPDFEPPTFEAYEIFC